MPELWPHQSRAVAEVLLLMGKGEQRICLTSPTGGGKTRIICELIRCLAPSGLQVVVYTNRRILVEQLRAVLTDAGISFGTRAAGYDEDLEAAVQISSIPTERQRLLKRKLWTPHGDGGRCLVVPDEAHANATGAALELLEWHVSRGHCVVGPTATPIDLGHFYKRLVVAGTNSELRECGALVPARHFGPDEPDMRQFKKLRLGEDLSENQQRKAMGNPDALFGRIWTWFERINPEHRASIVFGPGVQESLWIAGQFCKKGISAAHIDGEDIWREGRAYKASPEARQTLLEDSKNGRCAVICNRFVLREGVDAPWLGHCVFATVYGSVQSYLQSGGRVLRSYPGLQGVTVQDHGGNWWRHGSLNSDRIWDLRFNAGAVCGVRADRLRQKLCARCGSPLVGGPICKECCWLNEVEPRRCPECALILVRGHCESCGWDSKDHKPTRPVITTDGRMVELAGDIFRKRPVCKSNRGPADWARFVKYRSGPTKADPNRRPTFAQLEALFAQEHHWQWPDRNWPWMPKDSVDIYRRVADVAQEDLIAEACYAAG